MTDTKTVTLTKILVSPKDVNFMNLTAQTAKLFERYIATIRDEENPVEAMHTKGYTPRELGLRRSIAHNKLMQQLEREGVCCDDRAAITEMAFRFDCWMRED